jgi:hypothetical protein
MDKKKVSLEDYTGGLSSAAESKSAAPSRNNVARGLLTSITLAHRDFISQRQRYTLRFTTDADVACNRTRFCLFDAEVCERIFA